MLSVGPSGLTVRELAAEMNVSENTVRRDLRTFQKAGFPIAETVQEYGRKKWRIDSDKAVPDLAFTFEEAASLYLGRRLLEPEGLGLEIEKEIRVMLKHYAQSSRDGCS